VKPTPYGLPRPQPCYPLWTERLIRDAYFNHNGMMRPFVQGYWAWAAATRGEAEVFARGTGHGPPRTTGLRLRRATPLPAPTRLHSHARRYRPTARPLWTSTSPAPATIKTFAVDGALQTDHTVPTALTSPTAWTSPCYSLQDFPLSSTKVSTSSSSR
jgi:hypothetical protein